MQTFIVVVIGFGVALAVSLMLLLLPSRVFPIGKYWLSDSDRVRAQHDLRVLLVQASGGAILLLGLFYTSQTLQISQQTLKTGQQVQLDDRFTKAIGEMGSDKVEVRVGGIFALEGIAKDSPERNHLPTVELLSVYLKQHAADSDAAIPEGKSCSAAGVELRPDLDAAAIVLGRRPDITVEVEHDEQLNLVDANLHNAHLEKAQFQNSVLYRAHLECADLRSADLTRSLPIGAYLVNARLGGVDRRFGAHMYGAILTGAKLMGADMRYADLRHVSLAPSGTVASDLTNAKLRGATVDGSTDFTRAVLSGTDFTDVDLSQARGLTDEQLQGARVCRTKLPKALTGRVHETCQP
jgi:hypothetical protein